MRLPSTGITNCPYRILSHLFLSLSSMAGPGKLSNPDAEQPAAMGQNSNDMQMQETGWLRMCTGRGSCRGAFQTRPLYGVCQGGRNGPANSSCFLPCFLPFFLASFLACFFVHRDVSSSRRHFLPYFASSTESVGRFCPEAWSALSRS